MSQVLTEEVKIPAKTTSIVLRPTQVHDESILIQVTNIPAPHTGHIKILQLNRPEARNAISRALLASLSSEIAKIKSQYNPYTDDELITDSLTDSNGPTRALIIASADDRSFCAGADLRERKTFSHADTAAFLAFLRTTLNNLENLPIPVIAAIATPALGGGFELALAAHMRVVGTSAELALPETRLAIIPGAGGMRRLATLVGIGRARELVLTGRRVNGEAALKMGIADRLVETDSLDLTTRKVRVLEEAVTLARTICEGGPVATRMVMRVFREPSEEAENAAYERVVRTKDRDSALVAFAEKKRPVFEGI